MAITTGQLTPSVVFQGDSVELYVVGTVQAGGMGPDSITTSNGLRAVGSLLRQKFRPTIVGGADITVTAWGRNSRGAFISTQRTLSYEVAAIPDSVNFALRLLDTVGDTVIQGDAVLPIAGRSVTIKSGTTTTVRLEKGKTIEFGLLQHDGIQNINAWELNDGTKRSLFPAFRYAVNSAPGYDSITPTISLGVTIYAPSRNGKDWNESNLDVFRTHCQSLQAGNRVPSSGSFLLYIMTPGGIAGTGTLGDKVMDPMDPVYRSVISQVVSETLQRYPYRFTVDSGSAPPLETITLSGTSGKYAGPARRVIIIGQRAPSSNGGFPSNYYNPLEPNFKSVEAGEVTVDRSPYSDAFNKRGWYAFNLRSELDGLLDDCDDIQSLISFQQPGYIHDNATLQDWQPWDYARRKVQDRHALPAADRRRATATTSPQSYLPPFLIIP